MATLWESSTMLSDTARTGTSGCLQRTRELMQIGNAGSPIETDEGSVPNEVPLACQQMRAKYHVHPSIGASVDAQPQPWQVLLLSAPWRSASIGIGETRTSSPCLLNRYVNHGRAIPHQIEALTFQRSMFQRSTRQLSLAPASESAVSILITDHLCNPGPWTNACETTG